MKKLILNLLLCTIISGCSTFNPPNIEDYQGVDYAILRVNNNGIYHTLRTYQLENGCYKRTNTQILVEGTLLQPDVIKSVDYKIKAKQHYAIVHFDTKIILGKQYLETHLYTFVPIEGHIYNIDITDLTTGQTAERWPSNERCAGLD